MKHQLLTKIHDHSATVAVIGLGYVGLPLAVAFAEKGFPVVGIEVDGRKVAAVQRGESYVQDIPSERLAALTNDERWRAISHPGMLVVLESTTYPGTTEELLLPMLCQAMGVERCAVGQQFFLAFSPERIDPGNQRYTVENTPKVVGGTTPACREVAEALYGAIIERIVPVSSTQAAAMVKLLANTFRAMNIALVNEIAVMCDKLELDPWEVIESAATNHYGFMKFTPGLGVGGHCIPLDPFYLSWKLKTLNYNARFIQLAAEIA